MNYRVTLLGGSLVYHSSSSEIINTVQWSRYPVKTFQVLNAELAASQNTPEIEWSWGTRVTASCAAQVQVQGSNPSKTQSSSACELPSEESVSSRSSLLSFS